MPTYPLLKFVSAPETTATVRLNLNTLGMPAGQVYPGREFSLGSPAFDGLPGGYGGQYGSRTIRIGMLIVGTKAESRAAVSAISRELLRAGGNWLLVQLSAASPPMWLRTYQSTPQALDWSQLYSEGDTSRDVWGLELQLEADAFAYGARVLLPQPNLVNNPSQLPTALAPPVLNTPTTSTTGGTLPAATHFYVVTAVTSGGDLDTGGETTISNRVSRVTTGSTSTVTLTWGAVPGANGYRIYRSTTSGSELRVATVGDQTSYVDTGSATAFAFPTTNDTGLYDPAAHYPLPTILGDAPAPLRVAYEFDNVGAGSSDDVRLIQFARREHLLAVSAWETGTAPTVPILWEIGTGDVWTAGSDTGSPVSDVNYVSGSYRSVSFATTPGDAARLTGVMPAIPAGRYLVFVRCARSDLASTFSVRLGQSTADTGEYLYTDTALMDRSASTVAGHAVWLNMGDVTWPLNFPFGSVEGGSEVTLAGYDPTTVPTVELRAARLSGTGALRLDAVLLIPVETVDVHRAHVLRIDATALHHGIGRIVLDGESETIVIYDENAPWQPKAAPPLPLSGVLPTVTPGADNILHLLGQVSTKAADIDNPDVLNHRYPLRLSYQPRWLHLPGA